ncbi:unnamed protein product, partial [Chrysoparadoxa australica]
MLSSMLNVHTKACHDAVLTTHFDERKAAEELFRSTEPGDTVLFDRGYFSRRLVSEAEGFGLKYLFRLRRNACRGALSFWNSLCTDTVIMVPYEDTLLKVRLIKYFIDGKKYMCATNMTLGRLQLKKMYAKRWTVETSFRRLKTDLSLETSHSMTPSGFEQELEARILLDTLSLRSAAGKPGSKCKSYLKALDTVV